MARGAGPHRIECCSTLKNRLLWQVMMLFEQCPYFGQCRSRVSRYRRPCSRRVWSASRVGTLPSSFRTGRRLYRRCMMQQSRRSTSTVDSFSFLFFSFICHSYPAFASTPSLFPPKNLLFVVFFVLFLGLSVCTGPECSSAKSPWPLNTAYRFRVRGGLT